MSRRYIVFTNDGYAIDENLTARQAVDRLLTYDGERYRIKADRQGRAELFTARHPNLNDFGYAEGVARGGRAALYAEILRGEWYGRRASSMAEYRDMLKNLKAEDSE